MNLSTALKLGVFFLLGAAAFSLSSGEPPTNKAPTIFVAAQPQLLLPTTEIVPEPPTLLIPASAPIEEAPPTIKKTISPEPRIMPEDVEILMALDPQMPIDDLDPFGLDESFREERSNNRKHRAIDMTAPRGKPIRAAIDGTIVLKNYSAVAGKSLYQKDPNGEFMLFYAHLSRYAKDLKPGQTVKKGDIIGYVGDTGNAKGHPHLHFAIAKLIDPSLYWSYVNVNPYYVFTKKPYPFRKK